MDPIEIMAALFLFGLLVELVRMVKMETDKTDSFLQENQANTADFTILAIRLQRKNEIIKDLKETIAILRDEKTILNGQVLRNAIMLQGKDGSIKSLQQEVATLKDKNMADKVDELEEEGTKLRKYLRRKRSQCRRQNKLIKKLEQELKQAKKEAADHLE